MKIAVDAMGGDYAPAAIVEGSVLAAKEFDIPIILVGDRERIEAELKKYGPANANISVKHTTEVVGMDEGPTQAIRRKKDSSLRVCFDLVNNGEASAVISAGNSGAAMAAGIFLFKKIKGVDRPAIAVSMPTMKGSAVIIDAGGNVDCKPAHLVQFAIMGDVYAKYVIKKDRPKVGLLSNGEEEGKGNELTRETHALLKDTALNYVGYMEGRDIFTGDVDVVVTDGFVGNVVLKVARPLLDAMEPAPKRFQRACRQGELPARRGAFGNEKRWTTPNTARRSWDEHLHHQPRQEQPKAIKRGLAREQCVSKISSHLAGDRRSCDVVRPGRARRGRRRISWNPGRGP